LSQAKGKIVSLSEAKNKPVTLSARTGVCSSSEEIA
jgi:hypothetical protein